MIIGTTVNKLLNLLLCFGRRFKICLPVQQITDTTGEYSYICSDKHLPTRQTWRPRFSLTAIFTLWRKKDALKLQPQFFQNIIIIIMVFFIFKPLTFAPASPFSPWKERKVNTCI